MHPDDAIGIFNQSKILENARKSIQPSADLSRILAIDVYDVSSCVKSGVDITVEYQRWNLSTLLAFEGVNVTHRRC